MVLFSVSDPCSNLLQLFDNSAVTSSYDQLVGLLILLSGLQAKSRLAPGSAGTGTSDTSLTFTTTVRMVVGVHYRTAYGRTDAHVTFSTSFTNIDQSMLAIAYNADSCAAGDGNHSHLSGGKTKGGVFAFLCH